MTSPVRSPLSPVEPPPKGSPSLRLHKEISSFKEQLAEARAKAAGQPALRGPIVKMLEASPFAPPVQGPVRDCEGIRERPWLDRMPADEKRGEADVDDRHHVPDRAAPSVDSGLFFDQLIPVASGVGQAEQAPRFGAGPMPIAELWNRLVRRVALGGDGRRVTARIEIGAGEWAGAAIVVHAVEREISLEIDLPAGARLEAWRERIADRFRERGLELAELTVR